MDKNERNKHLRELADLIAAEVAPVIGLKHTPRCARITKRKGRGYVFSFSVPQWATKFTDYFIYYVAHEVCHAVASDHGPVFKTAERKALAHFGMVPEYAKGGAGPYVSRLLDVTTGDTRVVATQAGAWSKQATY